MTIKNTLHHYGIVAILLHWGIAIIIIGLLAEGLYMVGLPISLQKLKLFGWHKEYGMLILALASLRLGWRLTNRVPLLPETIPVWQKWAATAVHWAFYGFMFAMPLTGWLITSAASLPVSFFGWFTLPDLVSADPSLQKIVTQLHQWVGYGLIATICLHTGAALEHHFIRKDNVLKGMLP